MKRKIIIGASTIFGAVSVGAAITVPVSTTDLSSSNIGGSDTSDNTTNIPGTSDDALPSDICQGNLYDVFYLALPWNEPITDSASLATKFKSMFVEGEDFAKNYSPSGSQTSYLQGADSFRNVTLEYKSVSFERKFSWLWMLARPFSGTKWSSGISNALQVSVEVHIVYLSESPNSDTFNYQIRLASDNSQSKDVLLNNYLTNLFQNSSSNLLSSFSSNFINSSSYHNVQLSYVQNSANYSQKTFQVLVTPVSGTMWSDRSTTPKTLTVSLSDLA